MGDYGYFMVHSCEDGTGDHHDNCDAVFVWAETAKQAVEKAKPYMDSEAGYAERESDLDQFHAQLGDVKALYQMSGALDDKALRAAHFGEYDGTSCDTCGLYEFDSLEESHVCRDCLQCGECGCDCVPVGDEACAELTRLTEEMGGYDREFDCNKHGCRPGCPHIAPNGDRGIQKS